ncbi:MAG: hypothetical protein Q7U41_01855 [Microbacterium sp.]|nr:hypothetical protein [Microbacterium sp.]
MSIRSASIRSASIRPAPRMLVHVPWPGAPLSELRRLPAADAAAGPFVVPDELVPAEAVGWLARGSAPTRAWQQLPAALPDRPTVLSLPELVDAADRVADLRAVLGAAARLLLVLPRLGMDEYHTWQQHVLAGGTATWSDWLLEAPHTPDPAALVEALAAEFGDRFVVALPDRAPRDLGAVWDAAGLGPSLVPAEEVADRSAPVGFAELSLVRRLTVAIGGPQARLWPELVGAGLVGRLCHAAISVDAEVLFTGRAIELFALRRNRLTLALRAVHTVGTAESLWPDPLPAVIDEPGTVDRGLAVEAALGMLAAWPDGVEAARTGPAYSPRAVLAELRRRRSRR